MLSFTVRDKSILLIAKATTCSLQAITGNSSFCRSSYVLKLLFSRRCNYIQYFVPFCYIPGPALSALSVWAAQHIISKINSNLKGIAGVKIIKLNKFPSVRI